MPENPILPDTLTSELCVLNRLALTDSPALYPIFSNPDAMRFVDIHPASSLEDTEMWINRSLAMPTAYHGAWSVALIAERKEGAPLITSGIVTDIKKFTQRDHNEELKRWELDKIEFFVAILGRIQKAIGCVRPEDAIEPRPYPSPEA